MPRCSFLPRPGLSLKLATPNNSTQCHTDETNQWAADWFRKWHENKYDTIKHFGEVFYAALNREPGALDGLISIANDIEKPTIVRASALKFMEYYPSMRAVKELQMFTNNNSSLIRLAAIQTLSQLQGNQSISFAIKLLNDSVRAIRYEAALAYSKVPYIQKSDQVKDVHTQRLEEYISMILVNNDQAATHVNIGV